VVDTIVLMIDDFQQAPNKQPTRLDSTRDLRPRSPEPLVLPSAQTPADQESVFRMPEQVATTAGAGTTDGAASGTDSDELLLTAHATGDIASKKPKSSTITLFKRWTVSKKKLFIISAAAVVLIAGGTTFALTRSSPEPAKPVATKAKAVAAPAPKPIVSPLTGMVVTAEQRDLPVTGVMIENSPDARPQSGLKEAGVVYEAIAEAGITRFLALYQEAQPGNVGPIRSSRPYYLDWAMAFDASYAHVGGSPDALQRIKDIQVKDLDQFYNPVAYHRITTRYAPHNVYTGVAQLVDLEKSKGYDKSTFTSFARKTEQPYKTPAAAPAASATSSKPSTAAKAATDSRTPANSINFAISGDFYNVHYDYDASSNSYKRSEGGAPHLDAESNTQLTPKVVVSLVMPYSLMDDGYHSQYNTIGSGKMFVFQDGTVQTGTWSKGQPKEQFVFKDDAGKVLPLNPGQTWISVVGDAGNVTYQ
jgi:hypothetical protein